MAKIFTINIVKVLMKAGSLYMSTMFYIGYVIRFESDIG